MILIIDSGATNSTWKYIESSEDFETVKLRGFNLSTTSIDDQQIPINSEKNKLVKSIFFFGAGTGHPKREMVLQSKLQNAFPNCKQFTIGSDLYSAALALSFNKKGVVSILGTGSNCCQFDGLQITKKINNLGFILGDEGSGYQMGKTILQNYFYAQMDSKTHNLFHNKYNLTRNELIQKVYHEDKKPNSYIAGFSSFLKIAPASYRKSVSFPILESFFKNQLTQLKDKEYPDYHFSGSISWHFQDTIKKLCLKYDCKVGNIVQNPLDSLSYSKLIQIQK